MSSMLEKIIITLFLILGLNVFNITHAQDDVYRTCPVQGQVNMRLIGTVNSGQLQGYIDNKFVSWFVIAGYINGVYNGNFMDLRLAKNRFNEYNLTGWIGSYFVNWRTFGGQFNEYIYC